MSFSTINWCCTFMPQIHILVHMNSVVRVASSVTIQLQQCDVVVNVIATTVQYLWFAVLLWLLLCIPLSVFVCMHVHMCVFVTLHNLIAANWCWFRRLFALSHRCNRNSLCTLAIFIFNRPTITSTTIAGQFLWELTAINYFI